VIHGLLLLLKHGLVHQGLSLQLQILLLLLHHCITIQPTHVLHFCPNSNWSISIALASVLKRELLNTITICLEQMFRMTNVDQKAWQNFSVQKMEPCNHEIIKANSFDSSNFH
jgi:hypothetical protein